MGEKKNRTIDLFKRSLPRIRKRFKPERLYLFGSHAKGEALVNSDLDVVIVSERFGHIKFIDRLSAVLELIEPAVAIDLLCYTPEEFKRKSQEIGIVRESLKHKIDL